MVFWRDRRLGNILDQIEKKRGSSASDIVKLGRKVQERSVVSFRHVFNGSNASIYQQRGTKTAFGF